MERIGRAKAIRLKCIDCCAGQASEVRKCPSTLCALWRFRMGREVKEEASTENLTFFDDFEDEDSE